jgi:hypothetical protein
VNELYLPELEAAWEPDTGFLGCLRAGTFDRVLFGDFITTLMRVRVAEEDLLPARFVTLLWFIPPFMEWQTEQLERILAIP